MNWPRLTNRELLIIISATLALIIGAIGVYRLSSAARIEIDALATANADSSQWSLAQSEVEFASFRIELLRQSQSPNPDLGSIRRRFDVFYSRIQTVENAKNFAEIRNDKSVQADIQLVQDFLDQTVTYIDGSDAELLAQLPQIAVEMETVQKSLRELSLTGVRIFAAVAEEKRQSVGTALIQLAILAVGLVVVLLLAIGALAWLSARSRVQARISAEASQKYEAIFQTSLDAVIASDKYGICTEFNHAAEQIFGYTREEAVGKTIDELIIPPKLRAAHKAGMDRYRRTKVKHVVGKGRIKLEGMHKNTTTFPIELSISSTIMDGEEVFISYLRDITMQVKNEVELVKARDKAVSGERAKAELLAVMSHEMRTPLNGMLGTLELMNDTKLTSKQESYLRIISRSGRILLQHVNDVLDVSRLDAGMMELSKIAYSPSEIVTEVIENLAESANLRGNRVTAHFDPDDLGTFIGDPTRVQQILINLVGNAIKFTRNGKISVDVEWQSDNNILAFSVTDSGIGISEDQTSKIFQDFVTLDASLTRTAEGTGLGLGICRRLVEAMGGKIGVESIVGEGSVFWFEIPTEHVAQKDKAEPAPSILEKAVGQNSVGLNILVVEDNQINRFVVREMLVKMGHKVTEATNGREGVQLAGTYRFDAILMDISMPEMDGIDATAAIRNGDGLCANAPIFALTAHALPSDLQRFRAAGMNDAMTKPISSASLAKTLAKVGQTKEPNGTKPMSVNATFREPKPQPVTVATQEPALDMSVTKELLDVIGVEQFSSMRDRFFEETETILKSLQNQHSPEIDFAAYQAEAHKIAGSAAIFGASKLRGRLLEQEAAAKAQNLQKIAQEFPDLLAKWAHAKADLAALCANNPTAR